MKSIDASYVSLAAQLARTGPEPVRQLVHGFTQAMSIVRGLQREVHDKNLEISLLQNEIKALREHLDLFANEE